MSDADLERELSRWRSPGRGLEPSDALLLDIPGALAYRNAGNLPDARGRTLRLVLRVRDTSELAALESKRLVYEPDFHEEPQWRTTGSRPVNVVPLRDEEGPASEAGPWWEQPELAALETEWQQHGTVGGVRVPSDYRGFGFKTVVSLRTAGKDVTATSIADSVARWVSPDDALRIRAALATANPRAARSTITASKSGDGLLSMASRSDRSGNNKAN
jgi:hypothetical protein